MERKAGKIHLETYMEQYTWRVKLDSAAIGWTTVDDTSGRGMLKMERTRLRLNHHPFEYNIKVTNSNPTPKLVTVRIFMVPEVVAGNRRRWIELDRFVRELPAGQETVMRRKSSCASIIQKRTNDPWEYGADTGGDNNPVEAHEEPFCRCGLPKRLLLPRGNYKGLNCSLFVLLTDGDEDRVVDADAEANKGSSCCSRKASSFCGSNGSKYPDKKPLGFPFDTEFPSAYLDPKQNPFQAPNFEDRWQLDHLPHSMLVPFVIELARDVVVREEEKEAREEIKKAKQAARL